ncbi:MAG TPA: CpsB/CapC family capsule biosynthesis tyrosine phosphatase [Chitinophagaceae bacterium]|nr:CpsB/CapC family capsule biosynthesis tyrosine phosphatase [Chitinophagaceae bacterium]
MFKFFSRSKQSKAKVDFSFLKADMHSHLIPGIDDGSPDIETSLQLIRGMMELGYKKLITTPHIMRDMYKNTRQIILQGLEQLRTAVKAEALDVEINAAAEYFLDDYVEGLIKNNEPLLTISGNMVLVEFSMAHPSMSLKDILFDLQMQGYQPVVAHPERYSYLGNNKEFYDELKDIGCLFQLNLLSLGGYYGKQVHDLAQYLIKKEYYDLVGTDLHHARHLDALHNPALVFPLRKLFDSGKIRNEQL